MSETQTQVSQRRVIEREIVQAVVNTAIAKGYSLSVDGGGEGYDITESTDPMAVINALMDVDEAHLMIHYGPGTVGNGKRYSWIQFVFGNDGYDVICDNGTNLEGSEILREAEAIAKKYEEGAVADVLPQKCRWFAACLRPATTTVAHPLLGDVPCCDRCAKRASS